MPYDPKVVRLIKRIGRRRYGEDTDPILGNLATGIVESHLQDLPGGDADSYGYRQQRESIYGRQRLRKQIKNFYNEWDKIAKPGVSIGENVANIQRPAAQYRGRYADVLDEAQKLLGRNAGGQPGMRQTSAVGGVPPTPGPANMDLFSTLAKLNAPNVNPKNALDVQLQQGWDLLSELSQRNGTPTQAASSSLTTGGLEVSGGGARFRDIVGEANRIDKAQVPYLWGGGHQAKQTPGSKVTPLDCSGAVSRVLGIDPRVSGQFEKWGRPGEGKRVTIYADEGHVLMKINGHFWGTSGANPGGGAGWIPAKNISPEYLSRFTVRHPRGM